MLFLKRVSIPIGWSWVALFLLYSSPAQAQSGSAAIYGRLWGPTWHPIVNGFVVVTDESLQTLYGEAVTTKHYGENTEGSYRIEGLPVNQKLLVFAFHEKMPGVLARKEVTLQREESKKVVLEMSLRWQDPGLIENPILRMIVLLGQTHNAESANSIINQFKRLLGPSSANSHTLSIDSRANSLMIDQVADAKNTNLTIGHTYRISLKSDAVPIGDRVCVMYQSQERGLTFDVLTDRSPITFTAAYFNFYAWLIDWINRSDNSGSAVVTIQDMTDNTRVTLAIDSRDESLMVDQQPDCKFTELISGKTYTATLNGDATPIGERIFVMFQSQERGFTFDVLTKGSPITFTAGPDPTFCAFLTDWVNRNDNKGEAVITFTPK
jgi:hypothetical protein